MRRTSISRLFAITLLLATFSGRAGAQLTSAQKNTWARLIQMSDGRKLDTAIVRQALQSNLPELRAAAALSIGQVGKATGTAGIPILRELLADRNWKVVANSAYALGLLGDSGSVVQLRSLLRRQPRIAKEAAWALGAIGAAARPAILSALADQSLATSVKAQVLLAAAKLRPLPVAELRPYLASKNPSLVWAASYSIARSRAVAGTRDMIALAAHAGTPRVRAEIARMLIKTVTGDSLSTQAIPILKSLSKDSHPHVRINALRSLATHGASVRTEVLAATRDRDPNVRIAAAQVAGGVLDTAQNGWSAIWARDTSFMYRTSLAASAAAIGVTPSAIAEWEVSGDWRYRAALASALGSIPNRPAPDSAQWRLAIDRDARVRDAALGSLIPRDTLKMTPDLRAAVVRALTDEDLVVRSTALGVLARTPSFAELDAVLGSYDRARRDPDSDARIAAVQYLSSLWKRDSVNFPASARERLVLLGAPTDPLERGAAGTVSLFAGWPDVFPKSRDLAWYEEIVKRLVTPSVAGRSPRLTINTVRGAIVLELFAMDAPLTVNNIMSLANAGYYKGTRFHRVVPNFVVQDGDPTGTGSGGPGYSIRDEMNSHRYERGALGMALSGPDTGGSQYFITHSPQPHLDGGYTVFGRVLSGWNALDAIVQGDLINSVTATVTARR